MLLLKTTTNIIKLLKLAVISAILTLAVCFAFVNSELNLQQTDLDKPKIIKLFLDGMMSLKSVNSIAVAINMSRPQDVLVLYINSPGGYLEAFSTLQQAVYHKKGYLITIVKSGSMAASAAAMTLLLGDKIIVENGSMFMLHLPEQFVGCKDPKKPSLETCKLQQVKPKDFFDRLDQEVVLSMVAKAVGKCLIPQGDYNRIEAGQELYYTGKMVNINLRNCK